MNTVKSSVTRCAGRTLRSRGASHHPTAIETSISTASYTSYPTTMLSFLYPASARRHIITDSRSIPTLLSTTLSSSSSSQRISTRRCYSTQPPPPSSLSPPPTSPSSKYNLEPSNEPWQYLLGESTEEEEASLRPQRIESPSLEPNHGRSFKPRNNDSQGSYRPPFRNDRSGGGGGGGGGRNNRHRSNNHSFPETPQSFSHRRSTHQNYERGVYTKPEYKTSPKDGVAEDPSLSLLNLSSSPRTNMTEREKVIFDMIFDKLLQKSSYATPAKRLQHNRPSPMVSALFESAVGPQSGVDDEVSFGPERNGVDEKSSMEALLSRGDFPASLRSAAAGKLGLSRKAVGLDVIDEEMESPERKAEYEKLSGMLELCGNDLEVWEWLDGYIFTMPFSPDGLTGNYPKLLKEAIKLLRTEYNDFSACTAVFEKVKQLGTESYIIGCSVGVYNEMLEVKWRGYRDMSAVLDLLEEMRVNGVDGDEITAGIVADVLSDVRVFESNSFLPGTVMVWRTEGVLEGKERLREMMGALVREGDQRMLGGEVVM
ncbi:hypothetical protein TWF225_008365 [Orbilia oligospora]|uniref:Uncharacterized protein n=1 Tax=Orbilia oligospora TaxID=2813651 RepID=A0A7C8PE53_ORBOL|nr:hypothetical protein TWF751_003355 [Orbilia oligospora]KAF3194208.1 hypothetical protein TWF225_008365 [Orbilia oligospora]KAF3254816.1 hypothetical protein TWF128_006122 [Orbilia oligospora]KAF3269809.1 hypothetical protein TWF217_008171 [Orbilia oligospora]KAF3278403.1 hypothetical protein TWF132_001184 [Orbilia oligospora]